MPIVHTEDLKPHSLNALENLQVYNGLDVCITLEVFEELMLEFPKAPAIYSFERAIQGPYLEIMQRGFKVDEGARRKAVEELRSRIAALQVTLDTMSRAFWGKPLNPRSPAQLKDFFYQHMRLPEIWLSQKGERKLSTNREALEKLEVYLHARPIIAAILAIRDLAKQLEVFETEIDSDGRFRTSYNIAGTECIAGDSLVWTKSGLRVMKELYETPYAFEVWNGDKWAQPVKKVKFSDRVGFSITLEGGFNLKCSENHPILTETGWREAKDLRSWNKIQINNGLHVLFGQHAMPRGSIVDLLSEDFCEFIGMWLCDGSLSCNSEHYRCRLSTFDPVVRNRFKELVKNLFNIEVGEYTGELSFSSKEICTKLKELGLPANEGVGCAVWKTMPVSLLRGKPNLLRALLRGLTLDSHLTEKGLLYGTQSYKLQDQIQQCLLILGIQSVKLKTGNSTKLNVPRAYCGRFISVIGFVQEEKALKLTKMLNQRCQWHEPTPFGSQPFLPIYNIDQWRGDVYDLTMPEDSPPQYVAQGFTVHNTGRPSSSSNAFGTGGNAQNIAQQLRWPFIADPGYKIAVVDLEQVEARDVGFFCGCLFNKWRFLDACESGDLHTNNSKLVWPERRWTGAPKPDRALADQNFYREFSFRDMSKRGGHLSNYMGTAWTMGRSLKIPLAVADEFQARYIRGRPADPARGLPAIEPAYPEIAEWWAWTATQLQTTHTLTTPFGRKRHFFGRSGDDTTLREAIAFLPQSTTADRMNLGMWRVWRYMPEVQLLAQTYDSITFQYLDKGPEYEARIIQRVLELVKVRLLAPNKRVYVVPAEAKVGWNWGSEVNVVDLEKARAAFRKPPRLNPEGLRKWSLTRPDTRSRATGLNRMIA